MVTHVMIRDRVIALSPHPYAPQDGATAFPYP
jgi:hypothetical protein